MKGKSSRPLPACRQFPKSGGAGARCPRCGAGTAVINSRPASGTIKRRRGCFKCHLRFTTFEIVADTFEEVSDRRAAVADLLRKLADDLEAAPFAEAAE